MADAGGRGTIALTQNRKSEAQMVDQEKVEAAIKLLLEGIGAVSYTHLDVYKRQV